MNRALAALALAVTAAGAMAQPVQWRVQDGGNGHWYEERPYPQPPPGDYSIWTVNAHATAIGGHLATVSSAGEALFVANRVSCLQDCHALLGGYQVAGAPEPGGGWAWVTGEPMVYLVWRPGKPTNACFPDIGCQDVLVVRNPRSWFPGPGFDDAWTRCCGGMMIVEWSADCNNDGLVDKGQILSGDLLDTNNNGVPDDCEGPCTFSTQPQPQSVTVGSNAGLSVTFARPGQSFQWRRNGTPLASGGRISGTTTSSLTITSVAATDQGTYDCLVTGSCGSVVSNPATLTVSTCPVGWTGTTTAPFGTRNVHAQAYAAVNGGTLLFGGTTPANTAMGDTWLLRAGTWSQVASTGPAARAFVAMAPLPNGRVLLFGGQTVVNSVASSQGDTWEWNGTAWNRLNVPGPSARAGHSMVLDTARNRVVLFGGLDAAGALRQDTWEWTGSAWTQVATSGPPGNFGQASAFDPVRGETLIFGGAGSGSSQTWAWNGTSWRQAATTGIVARNYPAMAFDESLGRILLFGGFEGGANVRGDAYLWTGSAWTPSGIGSPPSPRWKHGLSFDRTANAMVITAGTGYGQVPLSDWNVLASGPQPTGQPADASLVPGGVATFTFGVSGGSVAYRWHRNGSPMNDGGAISGAAYPTLTISSVNAADQGVYHCVATGPCGSITSRTATLTCRPVISQQPAGGTYVGGQPVTLAVVATGGGGATYRWRKDGVNLFNGITYAGVTTPMLTITADEPSQSGDYSVVITNACGTAVSDIATVEVTCPADFNGDGGTDGQDLFDFFEAWSGGESNADLNFDGGIDGGDVTAFYVRWENGC